MSIHAVFNTNQNSRMKIISEEVKAAVKTYSGQEFEVEMCGRVTDPWTDSEGVRQTHRQTESETDTDRQTPANS